MLWPQGEGNQDPGWRLVAVSKEFEESDNSHCWETGFSCPTISLATTSFSDTIKKIYLTRWDDCKIWPALQPFFMSLHVCVLKEKMAFYLAQVSRWICLVKWCLFLQLHSLLWKGLDHFTTNFRCDIWVPHFIFLSGQPLLTLFSCTYIAPRMHYLKLLPSLCWRDKSSGFSRGKRSNDIQLLQ